ncbi:hypothetical protein [Erwinia amylovora]|nr:hypothetical protein [Erwinia amylovora]
MFIPVIAEFQKKLEQQINAMPGENVAIILLHLPNQGENFATNSAG